MPDFDCIIPRGTVAPWIDPPTEEGEPSRLNPLPGTLHMMVKIPARRRIMLQAIVGGVTMPPDSSLGGRLFSAWVAESPSVGLVTFLPSSPGLSSVQTFVAMEPGHYTVGIRRPGGGAILFHLDAEEVVVS